MSPFGELKFVEPLWLLAGVVLCLALVWTWRLHDARQRKALARFASPHLHSQLTTSVSAARQRWKRALFALAMASLCVALARPQAGFRWESVTRRGIEMVFAIDTSRSMLTPDIKPDRLTRAKLAVGDFVDHLDGDGVGLVAFAGDAFLQCPVTLDYEAFQESLDALDTNIIPRGGTDIASAIKATQQALTGRAGADKIMILVTDGEDLDGNAVEAAKAAAKDGLKIYTVGVGTPNGELIPLPEEDGGGFVKDESGKYVKSHLDEAGLKAIAKATGGLYEPLGTAGQGLDSIYRQALAPLAKHDLESRQQKIYTERYQWPLALAFASLIGSIAIRTRRRSAKPGRARSTRSLAANPLSLVALASACLLSLVPLQRAEASPKQAEQDYRKGDFAKAQQEYSAAAKPDANQPELQFDLGAAAYKAGDYPQAVAAFQKALGGGPSADPKRLAEQESAYYNAGNALYRIGQQSAKADPQQTIKQWNQAVLSYQAALQLRPDDTDSRHNLDVVKRQLDALKKQHPPQPDKQQSKDGKDGKDQQKPQDQSGQKQGGEQSKDGQQSPGDSQQASGNDKAQQGKDGQQSGKDAATDASKPGDSGSDQKAGQQPDQTKTGSQPKPQPQASQAGEQKDASGSPQNASAQSDGQTAAPGQMTRAEARQLLDSMKADERGMPAARMTDQQNQQQSPDQAPARDW